MLLSSEMSFDSGLNRSRIKAVKQLRQNNVQQLEAETKKMEERIRSLKEQMVREKEERERGGGIKWVSGRTGPLTKNSQQVPKKKIPKTDKQNPRKIKLLTDEPLSVYTKKANVNDSARDIVGAGATQAVCGQCDKSKATLGCMECAENYCVSCFTHFHQKGALKKHSTRPVGQGKAESEERKQPIPPSAPRATRATPGRMSRNEPLSTRKEGGLLLHGTFNEDESSASFADALKQWRNAPPAEPKKKVKESQGTSCGTSTTSEVPKTVELKLNFGPNKSLNYLDRLLLKKHRENPTRSSSARQPVPKQKQRSEHKVNESMNVAQEDFNLNYREIFQSFGRQGGNSESTEEKGDRGYEKKAIIEELTEDCGNIEETTACVVEEQGDSVPAERAAPLTDRPTSRSGCVSVMSMTSAGIFQEEANALVLEDLSDSPNSPVVESKTPTTVTRTAHRLQTSGGEGSHRVWSARSGYTGLSEFFLAGVKAMPLPKEIPGQQNLDAVVHSRPLLCRTVWIPQESVCITEVQAPDEADGGPSSVGGGGQGEVVPQIEEPPVEEDSVHFKVSVSVSCDDPVEDGGLRASLESNDLPNSPRIHDFGIVDFLKTAPEPSKNDFTELHRVSTVTPFSLTFKPPELWSDDESDDDFLALAVNNYSPEGFDKTERDADDRATLNELAWELASTTGRLTQCSLGSPPAGGEDSYDEDSIEENDRGSGLSSPEELNFDSEVKCATEMDSQLEDENLQSEVRALR